MIDLEANAISALRSVIPGDVEIDGNREIKVEGTGKSEIEVYHMGQWDKPRYHTWKPDLLRINIHSDVSRSPFGEPVKDDADQTAWALWEIVDKLMHDQDHQLGWVISSQRYTGPTITNIPHGDGAVMLSSEYQVHH